MTTENGKELGGHHCPDWDGLWVTPSSPEHEACTCYIGSAMTTNKPEEAMTDRGLLELAAKAAGYDVEVTPRGDFYLREVDADGLMQVAIWNPLQFDGDALRLANSLKLSTCHTLCEAPTAHGTAMVGYAPWEKGSPICSERYDSIDGRDAATRRAIVRAAAEIGRTSHDNQ